MYFSLGKLKYVGQNKHTQEQHRHIFHDLQYSNETYHHLLLAGYCY